MNQVQNGECLVAQAASLLCSAAGRACFVENRFVTEKSECEEEAAFRCKLVVCAPRSEESRSSIYTGTNMITDVGIVSSNRFSAFDRGLDLEAER